MDKKILFLKILLISIFNLNAQTVVLNTTNNGIETPTGMAKIGNFIYFTQYFTGKLSKFDYTIPNPVVTDLITGFNYPSKLIAVGSILYLADSNNNKIVKIDVSVPTPVSVDVVTGVSFPYGMALIGNELYFTSNTATDDYIKKIDITLPNPVATNLITATNPRALCAVGNVIYVANTGSAPTIKKVDITNVAAGYTNIYNENVGIYTFTPEANKIFYGTTSGGHLKSFNHTLPTPVANIEVSSGLAGALDILFIDGNMFVSKASGEIVVYNNFLNTASFNLIEDNNKPYPNPFSDKITMDTLKVGDTIEIFNTLGQTLFSAISKNEKSINLSSITTKGIYFFSINKNKPVKIIRE